MTEISIDCPLCGQENAHSFYQGTENGAPHGAGFWPMEVSDANQDCDCEIPERLGQFIEETAWARLELQQLRQQQNLCHCQNPYDEHDDDNQPIPAHHLPLETRPADIYPNGQCPVCGWGLSSLKNCHNDKCSASINAYALDQEGSEADICVCNHWRDEHTPDCEACRLNDESIAPHPFQDIATQWIDAALQ